MKWWDWMPWSLFSECWVLSQLFHCPLSHSSRGSLLSTIRVVSSAYLRLLIFLPVILIPACASSSPAFCLMYSAYKLNKQDDNIQPWHTPNSLNDLKTKLCTVNLWFVSMTIYQLICKDMWLKSFPYHLFLLCKKTYIYI